MDYMGLRLCVQHPGCEGCHAPGGSVDYRLFDTFEITTITNTMVRTGSDVGDEDYGDIPTDLCTTLLCSTIAHHTSLHTPPHLTTGTTTYIYTTALTPLTLHLLHYTTLRDDTHCECGEGLLDSQTIYGFLNGDCRVGLETTISNIMNSDYDW